MAQVEDNFRDRYHAWHTKISLVKSCLRIAACLTALCMLDEPSHGLLTLAVGFGIAELLGIAEEWI